MTLAEIVDCCAEIKQRLLREHKYLMSYLRELDLIPQLYLVGYRDKAIHQFKHLLSRLHAEGVHIPAHHPVG
jgi:hypothetical protein